jgi:hypothetical protein
MGIFDRMKAPGLLVPLVLWMVLMAGPAAAHPYQTALFMRFEDGTIEGQIFARGSREDCEMAKLTPPDAKAPDGKRIVRVWVEVMRAPTARGPK